MAMAKQTTVTAKLPNLLSPANSVPTFNSHFCRACQRPAIVNVYRYAFEESNRIA